MRGYRGFGGAQIAGTSLNKASLADLCVLMGKSCVLFSTAITGLSSRCSQMIVNTDIEIEWARGGIFIYLFPRFAGTDK